MRDRLLFKDRQGESDKKMRCIFCNKELRAHPRDGEHHVLPKQYIKILNLKSQEWEEYMDYKVPICNICHDILTELQKPLTLVSKYFKGDHALQLEITLPTIMSRIDDIKGTKKVNPRKPDMADEIDTGYIWTCPVCDKKYRLIHRVTHVKKKIRHVFEEVVE